MPNTQPPAALSASDAALPSPADDAHVTLARLRARVLELEQVTAELTDACVAADARSAELAALLTVTERLAACDDRTGLLRTLEEIITDLVGSEDFVILESPGGGGPLEVAVDRHTGLEGDAGGAGGPPNPIVSLPVWSQGHIFAMVHIFRLLPHKDALDGFDRELLEVVAVQAANAFVRSARLLDRGASA